MGFPLVDTGDSRSVAAWVCALGTVCMLLFALLGPVGEGMSLLLFVLSPVVGALAGFLGYYYHGAARE